MPDVPPVAAVSALALTAASRADQNQLAIKAQRYALADHALKVCGLVRPGCENASEKQSSDALDGDTIIQMKDVVRTRGVKQRLEDDFGLKIGNGEALSGEVVPEKESEEEFLKRTILQLRRENVTDVIKLFNRVEKNNRKAVSSDIAFKVQQDYFKKKVAADDAEEKADDIEHGTLHIGSPEEFAEWEDWFAQFEYRAGEEDFCAAAGNDVSRGDKLLPDDGTFAGYDLAKIRDALYYFEVHGCRDRDAGFMKFTDAGTTQHGPPNAEAKTEIIESEPVKTTRPDANKVKAELAQWSPALVVSSYRRLALVKHPDKEGGSPEAFQELRDHAKVLTEACAKFHGVTIKRGVSAKKKGAAPFARGDPKAAICAELPAHVKPALAFFGLTEEHFQCRNILEVKKARLLLSAEKERREKQIQKEKEPETLLELLHTAQDGEAPEDLAAKNLKQLKTLCVNLCKTHYSTVYAHIQKLK